LGWSKKLGAQSFLQHKTFLPAPAIWQADCGKGLLNIPQHHMPAHRGS